MGHVQFKGWTPATYLALLSESFIRYEFARLVAVPRDVTHQVLKPIPLRLEPSDSAPIIAKAAVGAEILIAPGPPGYWAIQLGVSVRALQVDAKDAAFYARESALMGAVRLADCVEEGPRAKSPPSEAPKPGCAWGDEWPVLGKD